MHINIRRSMRIKYNKKKHVLIKMLTEHSSRYRANSNPKVLQVYN